MKSKYEVQEAVVRLLTPVLALVRKWVQVKGEIRVVRWVSYEDSFQGGSVGTTGGFFQRGMRWKDYVAGLRDPNMLPYAEAIRRDVAVWKLRIPGQAHLQTMTPVFSDGRVGAFSWRGWGDLMAASWADLQDTDYEYSDFYF